MDIEITYEFEDTCLGAGYHTFSHEFHRVMEDCDYLHSVRDKTGRPFHILLAKETERFLLIDWVIPGRIFHIVTSWEGSVNSGPPMWAYEHMKHSVKAMDDQLKGELKRVCNARDLRVKRRERCQEIGRKLVRQGADRDNPEIQGWLAGAYPVAVEDHERDAVRAHWDRNYRKAYKGTVQVRT